MKKNKITITIDRPVDNVFEFTTNPKYTHLWIPSIKEETSTQFPPRIGTLYSNHGESSVWDYYMVREYVPPKSFTLSDLERNYHVRYSYKDLGNNQSQMSYFEWMKNGELSNPFTEDIFQGLKKILESTDF